MCPQWVSDMSLPLADAVPPSDELQSCRKVKRRQEAPRWVDAYTVPGQFVGVRYPPDPISDSQDPASDSSGEQDAHPEEVSPVSHLRVICTDLVIGACILIRGILQPLMARSTLEKDGKVSSPVVLPADSQASASTSGVGDAATAGEAPTARTLFAISSSPYCARRESANLDASIIEVPCHPPVSCLDRKLHVQHRVSTGASGKKCIISTAPLAAQRSEAG